MVVISGVWLLIGNRHVRTFLGTGNVLYFNMGGGYMREYLCRNSLTSLTEFKMNVLYSLFIIP